jgi:hypothetical protein
MRPLLRLLLSVGGLVNAFMELQHENSKLLFFRLFFNLGMLP